MKHKYGEFSSSQIIEIKKKMRKQIYFLLLCADKNTKNDYPDVDLLKVIDTTLCKFGGLNEVLLKPIELVNVITLLESAKQELISEHFNFNKYRKLILSAGVEVSKIKEGD